MTPKIDECAASTQTAIVAYQEAKAELGVALAWGQTAAAMEASLDYDRARRVLEEALKELCKELEL